MKKRTTKKKKRDEFFTLKKKAWTLMSQRVRERDGRCVTCGERNKPLQCGHYRHNSERNKTKQGNALWFDPRNLNAQCVRCNRHLSGRLDKYALYLEDVYGPGILQELDGLFCTPRKWTTEEIRVLLEMLQKAPLRQPTRNS